MATIVGRKKKGATLPIVVSTSPRGNNPQCIVLPIVTGTATIGSTVSVSQGTWLNNPGTFYYQWQRNLADIPGAVFTNYVLQSADLNQSITCLVTAWNINGNGIARTVPFIPISGGGGGGGGGLSAPVLGFPSPISSNPSTISISIGADWQVPDTIKLLYSTSPTMSSPVTLTHVLQNTDTTTISFPLPTFAGVTYLQAFGNHSGTDSTNLSNIVAWGDTVAPTITTSGTQSVFEQVHLAVPLTATDAGGVPAAVSDGTSSGWYISGGVDQLQFQVSVVSGVPTLQWINNGVQSFASSNAVGGGEVYNVQVGAVDYSGNKSTASVAVTVNQIVVSSFSFTNVNNAPLSTLETSNTVTFSIAPSGLPVSATVSGTGFTYSKNGGAPQAPGSFTVQNGDTLSLQVTSGNANSITETATVTVLTQSATWSVATPTPIQNTTTTGLNKSHDVNATAFQVICNSAAGAIIASRSTGPQNHVGWYVEGTINNLTALVLLAVDDGSVDLDNGGAGFYPGNTTTPGSGSNGFTVYTQPASTTVNVVANGSTTNLTLPSSRTATSGDTIGVAFNSSTKVVNVYYFSNGFGDLGLIGTVTLSSLIPSSIFLIQGGFSGTGTVGTSDTITTNYGGTSYVRTPPGGSTTFA